MPDTTISSQPTPNDKSSLMWVHPNVCTIHPLNTRDLAHAAGHIDSLAASIASNGQLDPAVGRRTGATNIEILRGACRHAAVVGLCERGIPTQLWILVHEDCDDDRAAAIIAAEAAKSKTWSAWEYSSHLDRLAERYHSNKKIAEVFQLDPANIGRARKVTALPQALLAVIEDKHQISARAASTFMTLFNTAGMKARISTAIAGLAEAYPEKLPADQVFAEFDSSRFETTVAGQQAGVVSTPEVATMPATAAVPETIEKSATAAKTAERTPEAASIDRGGLDTEVVAIATTAEDIELKLARDAEVADRRADIVGDDDVVVGRMVLHEKGSLTMTIDGPLGHAGAVRTAATAIYKTLVRLHGYEVSSKA